MNHSTSQTATYFFNSLLGIAFDRFLVFGTGGWAWGNPSTSYALTGVAPFVTNGGNSTGWTVGAGVDYAFTDSVFGRIEYRYTNLGTSGFVSVATNSADAGNRVPISDLRAGIAYKFGGSQSQSFEMRRRSDLSQ